MQQEGSHEWLGHAGHQPHMASAPGCVGFGKMHDMNESPGSCLTASPHSQTLSPFASLSQYDLETFTGVISPL